MREGKNFLSRDSIIRHKEYLKELNLFYSVLEKSNQKLSGLSAEEILKSRIGAKLKCEAYKLKREIELHKLYFDSFDIYSLSKNRSSEEGARLVKLFYLANEALKNCENAKFLCFYINRQGEMDFHIVESYSNPMRENEIAAIDLCEHAYIFDYGYKREKYLEEAFKFIKFKEKV